MNRIELLIKEKGYNMTSFAEKMNTTRQNLYAILKSPSYPTLEKVAEALDVPMWQLFASPEEVKGEEENTITCPHCGKKIKLEKGEYYGLFNNGNTVLHRVCRLECYLIVFSVLRQKERRRFGYKRRYCRNY